MAVLLRLAKVILLIAATVLLLQLCVVSLASDVRLEAPDGYVLDNATLLTWEIKAEINEKCAALEELTGAQVFVVTVDFLGGKSINDFAAVLFDQWQIGDPTKNNGLLLLISAGEEDYYVVQGRGLEKSLSDARIAQILEDYLEPDFAQGNYKQGTIKAYNALLSELESTYRIESGVLSAVKQAEAEQVAQQQKAEQDKKLLRAGIFTVGALLLILWVRILYASVRRRRRRRREKMLKMSQEHA